ncbi:MAG: excalibur calcium-binding domain-containing protein [Coleofasciculus sp. C1-SOL-03]|jgi:micrococcal nuclease|uniref:hypothetical protein n=1 Tax=Coleofasciculus sp. C1-SOL-03 TaxID=3069522 RepID=UPI0032FCFD97
MRQQDHRRFRLLDFSANEITDAIASRIPSNRVNQPVPNPQTIPANLPACANSDCDCGDLNTQAEAQAVFDAFASSGDPHKLDQDKDRIACESLP